MLTCKEWKDINNIISVIKLTKRRLSLIFTILLLLTAYILVQKYESQSAIASTVEFNDITKDYEFVLGGEITGIKLLSTGVLVIDIENEDTDLKVGDIILKVNGESIESNNELIEHIDGNKELTLTVQRENKIVEIKITPIYNPEKDNYELGIWVKDSSAGVGTITFYEKNSKLFAGLRSWDYRNRR